MMQFIHIIIPSYGLLASIGFFASFMLLYVRSSQFQISFKTIIMIIAFSSVGILVGSKSLYIITKLPVILDDPSVSNILHTIVTSGFVFYGGLFGGLVAVNLFANRIALGKKEIFNFVTPTIPLFHVFGRIGCFFAGCCFGITVGGDFVLPIQLIESVFELCLFCSLIKYEKREVQKHSLLSIYLIWYAIGRFALEFFRGDIHRGFFGWFSTSQWISLMILLCFGFVFLKKQLKHTSY